MKFKIVVVFFIVLLVGSSKTFSQSTKRFACIGDYGTGASVQSVANLVSSWNPDFVITVGDNNYTPNDSSSASWDNEVGQYYGSFIKYPAGSTSTYAPGQSSNKFFPALGNHDWDAGIAGWHNYFELPGNERYYDVVQGSVHLFFIDSDIRETDGIASSSIQGQWLQSGLANSRSPWKIVVFHHPPYSSSSVHGNTIDLQWPFASWGASLVLTGHDHTYERIVKSGFNYIVNGLGGRPLYDFRTPPEPGSVVRYNANYGAMLITATPQVLKVEVFSVANSLVDSLTLSAHSLPIVLSSFAGTVVSRNRVRLNWSTLSELNNYGFEVQRRSDSLLEFLTIPGGFVPGHGTTITPQSYTFTDSAALQGRSEYRLKQIDLNGDVHLTDPIQIDILTEVASTRTSHFRLEQNFPNPFNPTTTLRYSLERTAHVRLTLYDELGKEITRIVDGEKHQGVHEVVLRTQNFSTGTYFYRLESEGKSDTRRLVVLK